jgi:hypothetical protein
MESERRRRLPRLTFGIKVFVKKDWMIKDLNPLGCFIETSSPLPVDYELELTFHLPLDEHYVPVVAKGVVRRNVPEGMGIEFTELDPEHYTIIQKFVEIYC